MRNIFTISIVSICLILSGCTGSKKYAREAAKLNAAGLTKKAADFYFIALQRKQTNTEAIIGLKTTGQKIIDDQLNEFYKLHSMKEHREAVYLYRSVKAYQKKNSAFVELEVPAYYDAYYLESKTAYLQARYKEASELLDLEKFSEADEIFHEITTIDPNYSDAGELKQLSRIEPKYRQGVLAFENGSYRKAYSLMKAVLDESTNYKDAVDYKDRALERAVMTIAVTPFEASANHKEVKDQIYANVIQDLLQSKDPFTRVIDRSNTKQIIEEQKLSLSGAVDPSSAIDAGKLFGAKALITGRLLSYSSRGGQVSGRRMQAYQAVTTKKVNPKTRKTYTSTEYRKTSYMEYSGETVVNMKFEFKFISTETGEILASDVVDVNEVDRVNYATYKGNTRNLYPGSYKNVRTPVGASDKVLTSLRDRNTLRAKFTSRKDLKSTNQLNQVAVKHVSGQVVRQVVSYNPEP